MPAWLGGGDASFPPRSCDDPVSHLTPRRRRVASDRPRHPRSTRPIRSRATAKRFVGAETDLVYFDGNSLGRPPCRRLERWATSCATSGAGGSSAGGTRHGCSCRSTIGDAIGRAVIGRSAGQTVIGDSTTVLLYKLVAAAVDAQRDARPAAASRSSSTPTTSPPTATCVDGIAARARRGAALDRRRHVDAACRPSAARGGRTRDRAVVVLSHVAYRSGVSSPTPRASPASRTTPARSSCGTSATRRARCRCRPTPGGSTSPSDARTSTSTVAPAHPPSPTCATTSGGARAADPGVDRRARHVRDGARLRPGRASAGSSRARRRSSGMLPMEETLEHDRGGRHAGGPRQIGRTDEFAITLADDWLAPFGVTLASPRRCRASAAGTSRCSTPRCAR